MRFIHFIELIPQLWYILVRYRFPAVKYTDMSCIPDLTYPHLNPLFIFHMMDRIRQVIAHHLLGLELIRPYIQLLIRNKVHCCSRLLDQDITACNNPAHQSHNIKTLKLYFIRTELKLIQSQEDTEFYQVVIIEGERETAIGYIKEEDVIKLMEGELK